mgnify:CR=1 FL=1
MLGFEAADPGRYGRLVMNGDALERIVEIKEEGDSAGGSAKQARKREFQAILPISFLRRLNANRFEKDFIGFGELEG